MGYFDRTEREKSTLERKLEADPGNASLLSKLRKAQTRGPVWCVEGYDTRGKRRLETCPPEYQSAKGAKRYEKIFTAKLDNGEVTAMDARKATIQTMVEYHLDYLYRKKAGGYKSSCTIGKRIISHIGKWRLNVLDRDPSMLQEHFIDFPEKAWSQKYVWNYATQLRAAINYWLKMKRINMLNPCNVVDVDKRIAIREHTPTREEFESVFVGTLTAGLPDSIRNLLVCVYESGLRINEVLRWELSEMDLSLPRFTAEGKTVHLPYFTAEISKYGRQVKKRFPMSRPMFDAVCSQAAGRRSGPLWPWKNAPYHLMRWFECRACGYQVKSLKTPREKSKCRECGSVGFERKTLMQDLGLSHIRPFHDYRKSRKHSLRVEQGVSRAVSKGIMGHATDAMDDYYTSLSLQDLYAAVEGSWKNTER